jgi:(2R)-sulfolactate sulfo-lyase subunit beta
MLKLRSGKMEIPKSFLGYKRKNGRVGTRNYVIILPVDDISNACAEAIANNIKGTIAIPHSYGRLQFGEDLELFFKTIIGTGKNPNVAAAIVIGIEPKWTKKVVDEIAKTGKPVEGFSIEGAGDITTTMRASQKAQEFSQWASEIQRQECPLSDLWISVKCGESDTTSGLAANPTVGNLMDKLDPLGVHICFGETSEITGAEQVCASRAVNEEIKKKFLDTWNSYNDFILENKTNDLSDSQPTAGNIAGGLTTIEEKAFGNIQKIGKKIKYVDVLTPAEEPKKGAGLYFMDTSSAAGECLTLQAAAGFNIHLFPTGQGNIIGNAIEPVIKLTANPKTAVNMKEHIDLDVSKILKREMNLDQAGDELIKTTLRVASGRSTCAETLGHKEFIITKLYRSA